MARLIDSDEFKKFLWCHMDFMMKKGTEKLDQYEIKKLIDAQPTAYDVDKVCEELEKWSAEVAVISEVDGKIHRVKVVNAGRAIDIAREGGAK